MPEAVKFRKIRALLVNESPKMLKALAQILSKEERFTVVGSATNGRQALRYASDLEPDLIIIGSHLSKMGSVQAASAIKKAPCPPVVFEVSCDEGREVGPISKSSDADALLASSPDLEIALRSRLEKWFAPRTAGKVCVKGLGNFVRYEDY